MQLNNKNIIHERLVPKNVKWYQNLMIKEHVNRYEFAKRFVKNKKVVDIACGTGYGSKIITSGSPKIVYAIDISKESINYAKTNYAHNKITHIIGDGTNIPLKTNTIDVAISFETLEHIKKYKIFLSELKRITKPGGILIISTPNKKFSSGNINPFHVREFTQEEFCKELSNYFLIKSLFGQRFFPKKYLRIATKISSFIKNPFMRWLTDSILKYFYRDCTVYEINNLTVKKTPAYFLSVLENLKYK